MRPLARRTMSTPPDNVAAYPENPPLARRTRGGVVESQHRGAWVVCDASGTVIDGAGRHDASFFARSTIKALQALPLIETGAAERFDVTDAELALCCASHNAEDAHTDRVRGFLTRLGLSPDDLQCGPQPAGDPAVRARMRADGEEPTGLQNNCSGKHAGFLALARHLDVAPEHYLDPESDSQRLVRAALCELCDVEESSLARATDGCSAPTYAVPLAALATGFARVANPDGLAPARRAALSRLCDSVARHPGLIAGEHRRICTQLSRITEGRLFPKVGAEAMYVVGVRGADRGLALKIDDGNYGGMYPVLIALLERFEFLSPAEARALESWRSRELRNWAGLSVGTTEVLA